MFSRAVDDVMCLCLSLCVADGMASIPASGPPMEGLPVVSLQSSRAKVKVTSVQFMRLAPRQDARRTVLTESLGISGKYGSFTGFNKKESCALQIQCNCYGDNM